MRDSYIQTGLDFVYTIYRSDCNEELEELDELELSDEELEELDELELSDEELEELDELELRL
jgi:hypothetical protein